MGEPRSLRSVKSAPGGLVAAVSGGRSISATSRENTGEDSDKGLCVVAELSLLDLDPPSDEAQHAALRLLVTEQSTVKLAIVQEKARAKIDARISAAGGTATAVSRFERLKDRFDVLSGFKGHLTSKDLSALCASLGVQLTAEELREAVTNLDIDGDGRMLAQSKYGASAPCTRRHHIARPET